MRSNRIIALAVVASVAIAACGDGDDAGGSSSTSTEDASTSADPGSTGAGGAPIGDPVLIGATVSGVLPEVDADREAGLQAAVDRVNREGGVHGRPLEVVVCETQFDPNVATQCARDFIADEGVVAAVGTQSNVPQFYETLAPEGLAVIEPNINSAEFAAENVYAVNGSTAMVFGAANTCFADVGGETLAAMYLDNAQGAGLIPAFNSAVLPAFGTELAAAIPVPIGAADVSSQVASLIGSDPDCVVLALPDVDLINTVKGLRQQGYEGAIIYPSPSARLTTINEQLEELAEGLIAVSSFDLSAPAYDEFLADMEASYGPSYLELVTDNTLINWIGVREFADVANALDTLDRSAILGAISSLTAAEGYGLIAQPVDFTARNTTAFEGDMPNLRNTMVMSYRIENGEMVPISGEFFDAFTPVD